MPCKYYRMYQTIALIRNSIYPDFLTFLIGVGILAVSVSIFVTATTWNSLSIVKVMVVPALTFSRYIVIIFDLWKLQVINKIERKVLQICPTVVGLNVSAVWYSYS